MLEAGGRSSISNLYSLIFSFSLNMICYAGYKNEAVLILSICQFSDGIENSPKSSCIMYHYHYHLKSKKHAQKLMRHISPYIFFNDDEQTNYTHASRTTNESYFTVFILERLVYLNKIVYLNWRSAHFRLCLINILSWLFCWHCSNHLPTSSPQSVATRSLQNINTLI